MKWVALVFVVGLVVSGCGGDDDTGSDAGEFAQDTVERMMRGQWGPVWEDMHPGQQEFIDRDLYIQCQSETTFPSMEISVDEVYEDSLDVARVGDTNSQAVTLELKRGDDAQFMTVNIVDVDGEWKWITSEDAVAAYEAGDCP